MLLRFADTAGSATGRLLPTGHARDIVDGIEVTCIDNGMPVVVARAIDLGIAGSEPHAELAADQRLAARVQAVRLAAGKLMGLGDVSGATVPKATLISPPRDGGTICARTFIPVRPHPAIGVLGAVSVATALLLPDGVGADLARLPATGNRLDIEHPTVHLEVDVELDTATDPPIGQLAPSTKPCVVSRSPQPCRQRLGHEDHRATAHRAGRVRPLAVCGGAGAAETLAEAGRWR